MEPVFREWRFLLKSVPVPSYRFLRFHHHVSSRWSPWRQKSSSWTKWLATSSATSRSSTETMAATWNRSPALTWVRGTLTEVCLRQSAPAPAASTALTPSTPFLCADCADVFADGNVASGVYVIRPDGSSTALSVYCDMNNGGGWTVFQRRRDGKENFDRCVWEYTLHNIAAVNLSL